MGVLVRELAALYAAFAAGRPSPLPALPVQYADYAVWQREWLQGEVLEAQLAYWREQLAGAPPALELPTDRPRPAGADASAGAALPRAPAAASCRARCRRWRQREGATLVHGAAGGLPGAAVAATRARTTSCVGSPIAGPRPRRSWRG